MTERPLSALLSKEFGLTLNSAQCADVEACSKLEWVMGDGRGGFGTGTVSGQPTRRYHGLLVTALPGSAKRICLVGHLQERVSIGDLRLRLDRIVAAGGVPAEPTATLMTFSLMPWPRWTFAVGDAEITREILLDQHEARVLVRWTLARSDKDVQLEIAPFLPFREADDLTFVNQVLDPTTLELGAAAQDFRRRVQPYTALPAIEIGVLAGGKALWHDQARWIRGIELAQDLARGYGGHEDRFSPGTARLPLLGGESATLCIGVEGLSSTLESADETWERLATLARTSWDRARDGRPPAQALHWRGADDFLFRAKVSLDGEEVSRVGILAGFPWFGEWGRDVFLSLPGLTLARGDLTGCGEVLLGALPFLRDGLLPNIYAATAAESHFGSVDASLWFARAARLFRQAGGAEAICRGPLRQALGEIHRSYAAGTALGIKADEGGLILAGGPDLNPTWMDAQTSKGPVTPRAGCPVEIAALWILLLEERAELEEDPEEIRPLELALERARATFLSRFWSKERGFLADLWTPTNLDCSLRPNMVLAAAMDTTPLSRDNKMRLLDHVERELLTERGLRTLSPRDAAYVGHYQGGGEERDGAYHQGTVWPWLLGSYVELCLQARGHTSRERNRLNKLLDGVDRELGQAGLGHISEVFDGDTPQHPGGTMAQAWNTAELLRARALIAAAADM